jgi:hypothetical protein
VGWSGRPRWAWGGALLAALTFASVSLPQRAEADCLLGLICTPPPPSPPAVPATPAAPACPELGQTDGNPSDARVEPRLGEPLVPRRSDGRPPLGFNDYATWSIPPRATYAEDMALHRRVGSQIIRVALVWGHIERVRNRFAWQGSDPLYCAAIAAGLRPLFVLNSSPAWAVADPLKCTASPCRHPPKPAYDYEFQQFATAAAIRYPQALFEVWNEPNLKLFWGSAPSPGRYVQLLRVAYRGVKNGTPAAPVLGGALSNNQNDLADKMSVRTFLRSMYAAGAAGHMDAVSFHPAPVFPDPSREVATRTFEQVQGVLQEFGEGGRRHLVASELGASTTETGLERFTEAQQSASLRSVYDLADSQDNVDAIVVHTLIDLPDPPENRGYGWVRRKDARGFMPKRVYCDFAAAFGTAIDCAQPIPLG